MASSLTKTLKLTCRRTRYLQARRRSSLWCIKSSTLSKRVTSIFKHFHSVLDQGWATRSSYRKTSYTSIIWCQTWRSLMSMDRSSNHWSRVLLKSTRFSDLIQTQSNSPLPLDLAPNHHIKTLLETSSMNKTTLVLSQNRKECQDATNSLWTLRCSSKLKKETSCARFRTRGLEKSKDGLMNCRSGLRFRSKTC